MNIIIKAFNAEKEHLLKWISVVLTEKPDEQLYTLSKVIITSFTSNKMMKMMHYIPLLFQIDCAESCKDRNISERCV